MISFKKIKRSYIRFRINLKYSFNLKKPLLLLRILKNYFNLLVLKKIPLRYVDVAVGYSCNLLCNHCSASKFSKKNNERVSIEDYKKLAKQCLEMGVITVGFTGGEPVLYKDLDEIIKTFQPNKTMISLVTNATLLDEEKILRFKKLGVDIFCVSLDSFYEEEHDSFRGVKGAYQKTINSINLALKNGLKIVLVTTVTHDNVRSESIKKLIGLTKEMNLLMIFSLACPSGKWTNQDNQILLNEDDIQYMNQLFLEYPHLRRDFDSNWLKKGCSAGTEKLYFTPYGDVIPCPFIHISFGNIKDTSLEIIRSRLLKIPEFNEYHKKCLAGEDMDFSRRYVIKANSQEKVPVDYKKIFIDHN